MSAEQEQQATAAQATTSESLGLLDQAIQLTDSTAESNSTAKMIQALVEEANSGRVHFDKNMIYTIEQGISEIDRIVSKQLSAIIHHEKFQKLEGSWRGLHYLVQNSETNDMLKIKVLNAKKDDLKRDFSRAKGFDQSNLWNHIYEQEFGMPGGQPFGALVGDYEFENHPEDLALLEGMAGVAAGAFAPFITAPSPQLFGLKNWKQMAKLTDLRTTFDGKQYAKWKSFRDSEDSRFVVMTMPRTLARYPYGDNTQRVEEFAFEELPVGPNGESLPVDDSQYCWMNTAYVHATRLTNAFHETNWCTAIRGAKGGGMVEGLPTYSFKTEDGDLDLNCPTEIPITDRREKELSDLGFLPLCHYKNTDYSVFFGGQTTQKPKVYNTAAATENAAISARLPYIMASSRIAHYLKVMVRDYVGSFKEATDMQSLLETWIMQYVTSALSPNEEIKARYPLAEASIQVTEIPGQPGSYNAVALLRPWLQLEELNASVRMVSRIDKK